jgi:hypothetical protein
MNVKEFKPESLVLQVPRELELSVYEMRGGHVLLVMQRGKISGVVLELTARDCTELWPLLKKFSEGEAL